MTQTAIAIMLNGFAKTELREEDTVGRLCEGITRLTREEGAFEVRNRPPRKVKTKYDRGKECRNSIWALF